MKLKQFKEKRIRMRFTTRREIVLKNALQEIDSASDFLMFKAGESCCDDGGDPCPRHDGYMDGIIALSEALIERLPRCSDRWRDKHDWSPGVAADICRICAASRPGTLVRLIP